MTAHAAPSAIAAADHSTRRKVLWGAQILLAAFLLIASGLPKLVGQADAVETFTQIGWGQWFRYLVGALEIAGAIGLLIPKLSGVAALALIGLLLGAAGTNAFVLGGAPIIEAVLLVISALVVWGRWPRVKAFFGAK